MSKASYLQVLPGGRHCSSALKKKREATGADQIGAYAGITVSDRVWLHRQRSSVQLELFRSEKVTKWKSTIFFLWGQKSLYVFKYSHLHSYAEEVRSKSMYVICILYLCCTTLISYLIQPVPQPSSKANISPSHNLDNLDCHNQIKKEQSPTILTCHPQSSLDSMKSSHDSHCHWNFYCLKIFSYTLQDHQLRSDMAPWRYDHQDRTFAHCYLRK